MPSRERLILELLDETVRARRRRLYITRGLGTRLLGLKTVDAKLDRNVRALAVFGEDTLQACSARLDETGHPQDRDALVHLRAACAVQMRDPAARDRHLACLPSSAQALTSSRRSHASNRSGSRSVGSWRQARTRVSWTASWAR